MEIDIIAASRLTPKFASQNSKNIKYWVGDASCEPRDDLARSSQLKTQSCLIN